MIKRVVLIAVAICLMASAVSAVTLEEAVDSAARRVFVETLVDKNVLYLYGDWHFVDPKYRGTVAGALHAGLLCPDGRLLRPKSRDLSPLINGLIRFGISSPTFNTAGFQGDTDITFTSETLYIIDNEVLTNYTPDPSKYYYALVNKDRRAYIVWLATKERVVWCYKGKLFLENNGEYIINHAEKYSFGAWQALTQDRYATVKTIQGVLPVRKGSAVNIQDINYQYLDADVYVLGEYRDGVIKASYMEIK